MAQTKNRRTFRFLASTLSLLSSLGACGAAPQPDRNPARPLIGAIRWDPWVGDADTKLVGALNVGRQVERSLGPRQFHDRIPFFGRETGPDSVEVRETTQDVMDAEIKYAHDAGIDYWAFDWYPEGSGEDTARRLYLSSAIKRQVNYCFILGPSDYPCKDFPTLASKYFKDPSYQKVLGNRPIVYLFQDKYSPDDIDDLRKQALAAGVADPYVVKCVTSTNYGHAASCAFDGDLRTYWQAAKGASAEPWLEVDFGGSTTFDKAVIAQDGGGTTACAIQYWNGDKWSSVYTGSTIAPSTSPTTVTFPPVTATKARLQFLSGAGEPLVNEFQLYDSAAPQANLAAGRNYAASSSAFRYDAFSRYWIGGSDQAPYAKLMSRSALAWDRDKANGINVIPIVTAGNDCRPRILNPVSWATYGAGYWSEEPTPGELGGLLDKALRWMDANPDADPARSVLIYAWNEFDEGGWICPTLRHGADRLNAIADVLHAYHGASRR